MTSAGTARLDRVLGYALPLLLLILLADLVDGVVRGPQLLWNEVRLARAFSVAYGCILYPSEHTLGPIIGTLHAPVGYLLYTGLAFLKDPATALVAGCSLTVVLCLGPVLWVHMRAAGPGKDGRLVGAYGFLACASLILSQAGGIELALRIHVDAGAIGFAILSAGILGAARVPVGNLALACSAALSMLSVACKQTMAPIPVALACYLLLAEGPRRFIRYVLVQLLSGALIGAIMMLIFRPPEALVFNTYTLARNFHTIESMQHILEGMYAERVVLAAVIPALAVLVAYAFFVGNGGARARLRAHPWLAFLFVAVFQTPIALRGYAAGGADNHLAVVTVFLTMAVTVGLTSLRSPDAEHRLSIPPLIQRALLFGIVVAALTIPWRLSGSFATLRSVPAETAFQYEKLRPGRVYFPLNPLAVLLADGKLTHFDVSVGDRARAGFPITPAQFAAGLPPHYQLVAYPSTYDPPESPEVIQLLRTLRPAQEPGLEGWQVFGR